MKKETRTIGGLRMEMEQVGAETGNDIVLRLSRPATALMARAVRAGRKTPTKEDLINGMASALKELAPRDVRFIVRKLREKTTVWLPDGKSAPKPWPLAQADHFDRVFAGNYAAEFEWIRWGIELNAFFGNVLALLSERGDETESKSTSPRASIGSSGDSSAVPSA
jgi:hypothetical protein